MPATAGSVFTFSPPSARHRTTPYLTLTHSNRERERGEDRKSVTGRRERERERASLALAQVKSPPPLLLPLSSTDRAFSAHTKVAPVVFLTATTTTTGGGKSSHISRRALFHPERDSLYPCSGIKKK